MFDANELADMKSAQQAHMMDTGYRMARSVTANAYNEPIESFTQAATATVCGLEMKSGAEKDKETMTLIEYDAVLRLPIAFTIDYKDRFKVTKRYGESITALTFEVVSPVQRGPSGLRVLLRKVEA